MNKRTFSLIILIMLILMPSIAGADGIKSIIIVVDQMSLATIEELGLEKSSIGFMNLKTRGPDSEENLFLSMNMGRKIDGKVPKENIDLLGDVLRDEKPSHIGIGKEEIILWNRQEKLAYGEKNIIYNIDWLIGSTNRMLDKSNVLTLGYDFQNKRDRLHILKEYLDYYKENQIIILPKSISKEDERLLNKSLVPIVYIGNGGPGLLSSLSTKREGFIAIEDIAVQLKNTYGHFNKTDIGSSFKTIGEENPIEEMNSIYKTTMNLLVMSYIFHGFLYFSQLLLGINLLKSKKINKWVYLIYIFSTTNIFLSLLLGLFKLNSNILIYLLVSLTGSYLLSRKIVEKGRASIEKLIISSYLTIVLGTLFCPKIIYNSYIGFNNLVYGARYYGLNNGIMGVLLVTSILSFFSIIKKIHSMYLKRLISVIIFGLNMIVLSTGFGTNTGGFITSVILFIIMIYMTCFTERLSWKKVIILIIFGISLFTLNMLIDNKSGDKSHAIEFFYRLKENGFSEFIYMMTFKARELIVLTLTPPFSIVLLLQGIILSKLKDEFIENKKLNREALIILITSLTGFLINDTGMIMLIYVMNYFILYIIRDKKFI